MTVKDRIRQYLQDFAAQSRTATVDDDANLMEVLDSLQILRLISDLETEFGVQIDNADLTPENLGSVDRLADYIDRSRQ